MDAEIGFSGVLLDEGGIAPRAGYLPESGFTWNPDAACGRYCRTGRSFGPDLRTHRGEAFDFEMRGRKSRTS